MYAYSNLNGSHNIPQKESKISISTDFPDIKPRVCSFEFLLFFIHEQMENSGGSKMEISVVNLTGKTISLDVESSYKVSKVKEEIRKKENIDPKKQHLVFAGKQMEDDRELSDYNVRQDSTLRLVLSLRSSLSR